MRYRIAIWLVLFSVARSEAAGLDDLSVALEQASAGDPSVGGSAIPDPAALDQVRTLSGQVDASVWADFSILAHAGLVDSRPAARIAAARALALEPVSADLQAMQGALAIEQDASVQQSLARSLLLAFHRLPEADRAAQADAVRATFVTLLWHPDTDPRGRRSLAELLGNVGPPAIGDLRALRDDPRWGQVLHSTFPAAFARTGAPEAYDDIVTLFESSDAERFRVTCLRAIGTLAQGAAPSAEAVALLRTVIDSGDSPVLKAHAASAYAQCPGAATDPEISPLIFSGISATVGEERACYLEAVYRLGIEPDEALRSELEAIISPDSTVDALNRKLAAAILERHPLQNPETGWPPPAQ